MKQKLFSILLLLMIFISNVNQEKSVTSQFKFYLNNKNDEKCGNIEENTTFIISEIANYISSQKVFKINNFDLKYIDEKKYPNKLKLIEDDLKSQIIELIIKQPFIHVKDSGCDAYFFVNYNKINFNFSWSGYNYTYNFINAFINYEVKGQWIPFKLNLIEYKYQYTDLDILNVVFHKYLLNYNGKIQFFDPNLQLDFWYNQLNEKLKLFLNNEIFQINQETFRGINYYDFDINSIKETDFLEEKLVTNIKYKNSNKIFTFDIEYLWNEKKIVNFINTKLKNWEIKISHNFDTWTNKENQLVLNELLDFIGEKTIDENGFNVNFDLQNKIKIINSSDIKEIENKKEIELNILYNDNKINNIKTVFIDEPNTQQKNKLSDIKLLIEKNVEINPKELNFLYLEKDLDNCLNIIIKQLNAKFGQLKLKESDKELINYISENVKIDAYWLNLNNNKMLTLILENKDFKNILKLKLETYKSDKDDSRKIWNDIFQTNFNLLYSENKKYFIRTSYLQRYYYQKFQNIYDYNKLLPYIEFIWKSVLNYKDKAILYKDNKVIRAASFAFIDYKIINISTDAWDYNEKISSIRDHFNFNIIDIDGKKHNAYFNAVVINAKLFNLNLDKENYSFILPILIDSDVLPIE